MRFSTGKLFRETAPLAIKTAGRAKISAAIAAAEGTKNQEAAECVRREDEVTMEKPF